MSYVKTKGIILQSFDSKEKDRIAVVLTDNFGKINVKFRSVKSSLSKRSGYTDDLTILEMMLYKNLNSFTATDVQIIDSFINIKSNLNNYYVLVYLKELPIVFLEYEQKESAVFDLVQQTLLALENHANADHTLLLFIFKFLTLVGLQISFDIGNNELIYFSPAKGGFNVENGLPVKSDIYKEMKHIASSDFGCELKEDLFREILKLLNIYISYHAESKHFAEFIENLRKINVR
jgi:DNA repair protein RecO (recombination protein O)